MASGTVYGNTVQGVWRAYAKYSTSDSNTQTTVNLTTGMQSIAWGINVTYLSGSANINGNVKSASNLSFYSANGATVSKDQISHSVTYSRTTYAQTKTLTAQIVNNTGYKNGTSTASVQVTIPALASYTVSYNANGGSGAPGKQTKWYGKTLKLSSTKPTRTGYTFQGWATSSGGSVAYAAGANYTSNSAVTLYAVWKANTWTISYNANGGSGAPGKQTKWYGKTLKLSSTRPTRTNYNFKGWATSSTATSAQYQPGGSFTTNATTTLYAVWQLAYVAPRITNLATNRCNSAGTYTEDGTYAKITFNWATDRTVSGIKIVCNGVTTNVSGSGTSGSVSQVVGANALSTENQYSVTVTVSDSGGSSSQNTTVAPLAYIMDFSPQGGIGIGTVAPNSKELNVDVTANFTGAIRGIRGILDVGSGAHAKVLLRSNYKTTGTPTCWFRIVGTFGTSGGNYGHIDILVPVRGGSQTTIALNAYSPGMLSQSLALIIRQSNDDYVYAILSAPDGGWIGYDLQVYGQSITIIDGGWATSSGVTMKVEWFNSIEVNTSQFGGYPLKVENRNGYFGFALPDKTRNEWMRTTYNGLIPYQAGSPSVSSLGTSTWQFKNGYIDQLYSDGLTWSGNGLGGRVMTRLWSGMWSSGSITVPNTARYTMFAIAFSNEDENYWMAPCVNNMSSKTTSSGQLVPHVHFPNASGQYIYVGARITYSGNTWKLARKSTVQLLPQPTEPHAGTQTSYIRAIWGIL